MTTPPQSAQPPPDDQVPEAPPETAPLPPPRPTVRQSVADVWILDDGTDDPLVYLSPESAYYGLARALIERARTKPVVDQHRKAKRYARWLQRKGTET